MPIYQNSLTKMSCKSTRSHSRLMIDKAHLRRLWWAPLVSLSFHLSSAFTPRFTFQRLLTRCDKTARRIHESWECCPCGLHSVISRLLAGVALVSALCICCFLAYRLLYGTLWFVVSLFFALPYQSLRWYNVIISADHRPCWFLFLFWFGLFVFVFLSVLVVFGFLVFVFLSCTVTAQWIMYRSISVLFCITLSWLDKRPSEPCGVGREKKHPDNALSLDDALWWHLSWGPITSSRRITPWRQIRAGKSRLDSPKKATCQHVRHFVCFAAFYRFSAFFSVYAFVSGIFLIFLVHWFAWFLFFNSFTHHFLHLSSAGLSFFLTDALCLSAGRGVLRLTRLPRHARKPFLGASRKLKGGITFVKPPRAWRGLLLRWYNVIISSDAFQMTMDWPADHRPWGCVWFVCVCLFCSCFLFGCFVLVVWPCTVTALWIMYRSLFSSAFGAHCLNSLNLPICISFPAWLTT